MNKLIGGIALLFLVGGGGSSAHADGPRCAFYHASTYNCGFYSFEQCYETVRGAGGSCQPNFFKSNVVAQPAARARHPADVTDPCWTSRLRRPKARQHSIEHIMEMLANAPSSHQPTFCNLARCRRPWPRRRSGACRSMHQQDRAIRAGDAPVRGKPERRADGAAIDWRTARCPTDPGLDQTRRGTGESHIRGDLGARQASR